MPPTAGTCVRQLGRPTRHHRGPPVLGACPTDRRRITRRGPQRDSRCASRRALCCAEPPGESVRSNGARFGELRELCDATGDKASLAIAMVGLVIDHVAHQDRIDEASQLASEAMALIESVGDATLTVGLTWVAIYAKIENADWPEVLRWSQRVIDLADGDHSKGTFINGCPLALAFATRAIARYCLLRPGWHDDLQQGLAMARSADPLTYTQVVGYVYWPGIPGGVLTPDDHAMREIEDALRIAERSSDDLALTFAQLTLGLALVHRPAAAERDRGHKLLADVSEMLAHRRHNLADLPIVDVYSAREEARRGDRDAAIPPDARRRRPSDRRRTAIGVGCSCDRCSGGDTAGSRGRR